MLDTILPAAKALDEAAARQDSVQVLPDARKDPSGAAGEFWNYITTRPDLLPPPGTRAREYALRTVYHNPLNWMFQSAAAGLTKKWASATFQIIGKNRVDYFQGVLRHAQFNKGWTQFIQMVGLNFLRYDSGAFVEVIAPGNPLRPPTGPVTGLAVLDTLRCIPTGDPDYPVVYTDRAGAKHLMHRTRVFQLVDAPDADDGYPSTASTRPGYGKCALSRAMAIVSQQLHMNGYVDMKLDELPPPGYVIASNINRTQRDIALDNYLREQNKDSAPVTGRTVWFYATDPTAPADLKVITFSSPPDNWSYADYTELHVNAMALALGVDVQELWQLHGGNLGSSQQSKVLHAKGQGKMFGIFLVEMERVLNDILPLSLELKFGVRDIAADADRATAAGLWAQFIVQMAPYTSVEEIRRLAAANVDAYRDAVTDTSGQIVTLGDADPQDPAQIASDATPNAPPTPADAPAPAPAQPPTGAPPQVKALADTRALFERDFNDLLSAARDGSTNRRRMGIILRDLIRKYGDKAFRDGLAAGGVQEDLNAADRAVYAGLLIDQSGYVTALGDALFNQGGVTDAQANAKAQMWYDKSIIPFYQAGLASADANGMYEWKLGATEHCATCLEMAGQKHRLKDYAGRGILPQSDALLCGGFNCQCQLQRSAGAASGGWTQTLKPKKEHAHA